MNVRQSVETTELVDNKDITFCAHDEAETSLSYFEGAIKGWCIINKRGLFLEYDDNFIRAIGDLYCISGTQEFTYSFKVYR